MSDEKEAQQQENELVDAAATERTQAEEALEKANMAFKAADLKYQAIADRKNARIAATRIFKKLAEAHKKLELAEKEAEKAFRIWDQLCKDWRSAKGVAEDPEEQESA